MCQYTASDGLANDWHLVHLGARAVGGAGLVIVEATAISPEGRITPSDLGLWSEDHADALARIARFVERQGATPGIQIAHAGRRGARARPWDGNGRLPATSSWPLLGPSPLPYSAEFQTPSEMSEQQIDVVLGQFLRAAELARIAGFKVLELHMAHGYLLHSFLSPLSNRRQDGFGGDPGRRAAFPLEVARRVRAVWPEELPLFVRISVTDWADGGFTVADAIQLAAWMKNVGVDLIDCSSGALVPHERSTLGTRAQIPFAGRIRGAAGIATGAVGGITDPREADALIVNGKADLVLLGRALLDDPYWPLRAAHALGANRPWPVQYSRAVRHFHLKA
jgi:2,4-dienoyl-CoA reductase-like NADH-dependent reductase (Old Yellow Enzyme family)